MPHWLQKVIDLFQADTIDLRELAVLAGGDPKIFYRGISLSDVETEGQNLEGMEFGQEERSFQLELFVDDDSKAPAVEIARSLHQIGRQEERLAILLDLILRNPKEAISLIDLYSADRAKYANRVLKQIKIELGVSGLQRTLFAEETVPRKLNAVQLARIVSRPFSRGMPNNRGALLYYMAKHLYKYPDVNSFLRTKIANTRSVYIEPYKKEILGLLDQAERQ
jgi:hypothetical protein